MDEFKKLLSQEAPYKLSDEMMEVFCSSMEVMKLKRYDMLIKSGAVDDNVYVVKKGIIRRGYPVGDKTITDFKLKDDLEDYIKPIGDTYKVVASKGQIVSYTKPIIVEGITLAPKEEMTIKITGIIEE